jgi:hypothetical protein
VKWRMQWPAAAVVPAAAGVARAVGLPEATEASPRTARLVEEARAACLALAAPCAVAMDVDHPTFARVFAGDDRNDASTPLEAIHPRADSLALFVATLGVPVSEAIADLFARDDLALGYMLDAVASEAADALAALVSREVGTRARFAGAAAADAPALAYSPGYCGWHISGQAALFAALDPGPDTGVWLNDSFLMHPLKSVSGVVVVAPAAAHAILTDHDCCETCPTRQCQERLAAL